MGDLSPASPKDARVRRAFHHFLWVGEGALSLVYGGTWLLVQVGIVQKGSITRNFVGVVGAGLLVCVCDFALAVEGCRNGT